jgi:hypothetical protein
VIRRSFTGPGTGGEDRSLFPRVDFDDFTISAGYLLIMAPRAVLPVHFGFGMTATRRVRRETVAELRAMRLAFGDITGSPAVEAGSPEQRLFPPRPRLPAADPGSVSRPETGT